MHAFLPIRNKSILKIWFYLILIQKQYFAHIGDEVDGLFWIRSVIAYYK